MQENVATNVFYNLWARVVSVLFIGTLNCVSVDIFHCLQIYVDTVGIAVPQWVDSASKFINMFSGQWTSYFWHVHGINIKILGWNRAFPIYSILLKVVL